MDLNVSLAGDLNVNIPAIEDNNLMLNESISNSDLAFLVSHYKEKLSRCVRVFLIFNKELSNVKKDNEENGIENTRLKLRIHHLEKELAEHIAEFNKDDIRDVPKNVDISSASCSEICENSNEIGEKVDNCMNQDSNDSMSAIFLPSISPATKNYCYNSLLFQNEISSNPSIKERKARKTDTRSKNTHSKIPLPDPQNPKVHESFDFYESPCIFNPILTSTNNSNDSTTELRCHKKGEVNVNNDSDTEIIILESNVRSHKEAVGNGSDTEIIIPDSIIIPEINVESCMEGVDNVNQDFDYESYKIIEPTNGEMDTSTINGDFEHQRESLSTAKNKCNAEKILELVLESDVDMVSCISSVQSEQTKTVCVNKKSLSLPGDITEEIIDKSETGSISRKKHKRYKKKTMSTTAQTSKSQQQQISSLCDLRIEKSHQGNMFNSRIPNNKQSFSEGDISTEAVMSDSESENGICVKQRKKRKRLKNGITSSKTFLVNELINSSVETPSKNEIDGSEYGSGTETSTTVANWINHVKNCFGNNRKRKLEMKSNSIELRNKKLIKSVRTSQIEESDLSIQKPPRKRVETLDSEISADISFSVQDRSLQSEIIIEPPSEQDICSEVNVNMNADRESCRNKRKLRRPKKLLVNLSKDSDTDSNKSIGSERKLIYKRKEEVSGLKNSDTESDGIIILEKSVRSHNEEVEIIDLCSNTESTRGIAFRKKLRSYKNDLLNLKKKSNTKRSKRRVPKRKLTSHKERRMNVDKSSNNENKKSIRSEKSLSHKEGVRNTNQDSYTESNTGISHRSILSSNLEGEMNVDLESNKEIDESIVPKRKLRSHQKENEALSKKGQRTFIPKENSGNKNIRETSFKNRIHIEGNLKEVPLRKCFVLLKKISKPPSIKNTEPMNENHLDILPSEDAVSNLEEKVKFPVSSTLATNQKTEQHRHATNTIKYAASPTKENCKDDLSFNNDGTADINSDNSSAESVYDDSDCDPHFFMNDDSDCDTDSFIDDKSVCNTDSLIDDDSDCGTDSFIDDDSDSNPD